MREGPLAPLPHPQLFHYHHPFPDEDEAPPPQQPKLAVLTVVDLGIADTAFDTAFEKNASSSAPPESGDFSLADLLQQTTCQVVAGHPNALHVTGSSSEPDFRSSWRQAQAGARRAAALAAGWLDGVRTTCQGAWAEYDEVSRRSAVDASGTEEALDALYEKVAEVDTTKGRDSLMGDGRVDAAPAGEVVGGEDYSLAAGEDAPFLYDAENRRLRMRTFGGFVDGGSSSSSPQHGGGTNGAVANGTNNGVVANGTTNGAVVPLATSAVPSPPPGPPLYVDYEITPPFLADLFRPPRHPALKGPKSKEEGDEEPTQLGHFLKFLDSLGELMAGAAPSARRSPRGGAAGPPAPLDTCLSTICLPASNRLLRSSVWLYVLNACHGGAAGRKAEHVRRLQDSTRKHWDRLREAKGSLLKMARASPVGKLDMGAAEQKKGGSPRSPRREVAQAASKEAVETAESKLRGSDTDRSVLTTPGGPTSVPREVAKETSKSAVEAGMEARAGAEISDTDAGTVLSARTPRGPGAAPK